MNGAEVGCGEALTQLAALYPERVAIIFGDERVTFAQLDRQANAMARAYSGLGVNGDDIVAISLPNGPELFVSVLAAWKLGATPMVISDRLPNGELTPILDLARPSLFVGLDPARAGSRPAVPPGYVVASDVSVAPHPPRTARYFRALTSGGSTGRPKVIVSRQPGVVPSPAHAAAAATQPAPSPSPATPSPATPSPATPSPATPSPATPSPATPSPAPLARTSAAPSATPDVARVQLVTSPMFHTLGFSSLNALLGGATLVVMSRFDPREALALIERHRVTYFPVVPTMLHRIWRLPEEERLAFDLSSVETVFSTAGAFPAWLKKAWIDWLGPEKILEIYGSSEGYGSTVVTGEEAVRKPGTVGRPRFGPPRILDENGQPCAVGEIGLIYFERPPEPAYFYIGAEPRVFDGWETLGDMGWVDKDGYLFLADRRVDMIVTGGENVFPAEVEAALDEHPAVRSSVVVGLPDDDLGQRVHAIVDVGRDGGNPSPVNDSELRDHLASRLVRYKIPRTFEFVTEPLRSDAHKVRRTQLRDERSRPSPS